MDRRPIETIAFSGTAADALGDPEVWLREARERAVVQRANGYSCDCADCWSRSEQGLLDLIHELSTGDGG
jgi:hypothetical protein